MRVFNKNYLFGLITGILIMIVVGVYAAVTILASNISYSNSKTSATNVNDALNELYDKSTSYKDPDLHGADPVLASDLLPVTIANDGTGNPVDSFRIGCHPTVEASIGIFKVDDVSVFSRVLTADEVSLLYTGPLGGPRFINFI